ncbi:hypothetical protein BJX68DRAFT_261106 [Aspergillus pseudodeflectus]|uniref:F-box domain-containing protein n=1 Tax=Aspergillus pseudodeflectus TaxID=176178 RepID=A0ABR4L6G5_9EURO
MTNEHTTITILDLPPELIDQIANCLFAERRALRLTCKYLYHTATPAWARFRFGGLETDLSERSFTKLERIVNDDSLARSVKKLCSGGHDNNHEIGRNIMWRRALDCTPVTAQPATARLRVII